MVPGSNEMNAELSVLPAIELKGLSDSIAAQRLQAEGPNELPAAKPKSTFTIAVKVLREPMFLLLIATGAVYIVLGSIEEAIALGASVHEDLQDVGEGIKVAAVKDPFGNVFGIIENPNFKLG